MYSFVYRKYIFEKETVTKHDFPDNVILLAVEKYRYFVIEIYQSKEINSLIKTLQLYNELIGVTGDFALPEIYFNGALLPDSEMLYNSLI